MNVHSTAVAIIDIDIELDLDNCKDNGMVTEKGEAGIDSQVGQRDKLWEKLQRLQTDHMRIREKVMHLQLRMVTQRLAKLRCAYQSMEQMQQLLRQLQVKYGRTWTL